jgi:hypothetical protein
MQQLWGNRHLQGTYTKISLKCTKVQPEMFYYSTFWYFGVTSLKMVIMLKHVGVKK